jgi:hypothetical protein
VSLLRLGALLFLSFAATVQANALTLRIKSNDGRIAFFQGRKKLSDSQLSQICAAARARKDEIAFQRDKMTRDDALAAILKEAQCLGATHIGFAGVVRYPEPKSESHKHAKPRHKGAKRR